LIDIAYSPCPNDTFLFHAWSDGLVGRPVSTTLLDIEKLNQAALKGTYDVCKVSFAILPKILDDYVLLPVGAALGFGCGPKIVAKRPFPLEELSEHEIAIPGRHTTAHLLLKHLAPKPKKKRFCLYHEVTESDVALIIHEQRFTFQDQDYVEIADLGELWERKTGCPIPLGGVVAKRTLDLARLTQLLSASLQIARSNPKLSSPYIAKHAQVPHKEPLINSDRPSCTVSLPPIRIARSPLLAQVCGSHLPRIGNEDPAQSDHPDLIRASLKAHDLIVPPVSLDTELG
jgi:1,4-dihydroxy-6-naphthoate synthase